MKTNILGPQDAHYVERLVRIEALSKKEKAILFACLKSHYQESIHRLAMAVTEDPTDSELSFIACILIQFYIKAEKDIPGIIMNISEQNKATPKAKSILRLFLLQIDKGYKGISARTIPEPVKKAAEKRIAETTGKIKSLSSSERDHIKLAILADELANHADFLMSLRMFKLAEEIKTDRNYIKPEKHHSAKTFSTAYEVGISLEKNNERLSQFDNETLNELHPVVSLQKLESDQRLRRARSKQRVEQAKPKPTPKKSEAVLHGSLLKLLHFQPDDFLADLEGSDISKITSMYIYEGVLPDNQLPAQFVKRFKHISDITITNCNLTDVSTLTGFNNLTNIYISQRMSDKLKIVIDLTPLTKFKHLNSFSISSCSVNNFDLLIPNFTTLRNLNFSSVVNLRLAAEIWNLPKLEYISVSGCHGMILEPFEVNDKSKIYKVFIGSNGLTSIPQNIFKLPMLQAFRAGGNKLTRLYDDLSLAKGLTSVQIAHNRLDDEEKAKIRSLNIEELRI